jgi:hypothetical protein
VAPETRALLELLTLDAHGLEDRRHGLEARVSEAIEALGPIDPGLEQTLTAPGPAAMGTTWFVERHVSRLARFDDAYWCDPQAPASMQARFQGTGGAGLVLDRDEAGSAHRVFHSHESVWVPTLLEHLFPLGSDGVADLLLLLDPGVPNRLTSTLVAGGRCLAVVAETGDGAEGPVDPAIWFERHGEGWLPRLCWEPWEGGLVMACVIESHDVPGLGWRPAQTTRIDWDRSDDLHSFSITRSVFSDWSEVLDVKQAAFPIAPDASLSMHYPRRPSAAEKKRLSQVVTNDPGTWPPGVLRFFRAVE